MSQKKFSTILKNISFWILAFIITAASAIYQRKTGPTYPVNGETKIAGQTISYELTRSHGGETDQPVEIAVSDTTISGMLVYKRYKTNDQWTGQMMKREGEKLVAFLPNQPPAGKLEYHIELKATGETIPIPADQNIVTRFKGEVPVKVLIPHIFFIFFGMLLSARTGLAALDKSKFLKSYVWVTTVFLFLGGMIFGPIVQKHAFDAYWTGFPFGMDLTDNKTLIAMIGWIVGLVAVYKMAKPKWIVILATIITFGIFMIPHSMMGSELNYETMQTTTGDFEN